MKRYRYKIILSVFMILFMILSACSSNTAEDSSIEISTAPVTEGEKLTETEKKALEITGLYKNLYISSEKETQEYFPNDTVISRSAVDNIEALLIDKGYCVIDSDSRYPEYLANPESFYSFWEAVTDNADAEQAILSVSQTGRLSYRLFEYSDTIKSYSLINVDWDESNNAYISETVKREVMDWEFTENNNFYYQIYPSDSHYDNYVLLRLNPVEKELYNLNAKYILPIGYQSNNMFLCDWSSSDYGGLCFNDLLEYLYRVKNNDYFDETQYPIKNEPYYCSCIPADVFENTILPYFDISLKEFRKRTLYDSENNFYPWQKVCCDNLIFYPSVESDVIEYNNNSDGTITLTVNARCNNYKEDCLFTHKVVIRVSDNGDYQYLSNKITYINDNYDQPPSFPRLPPQRADYKDKFYTNNG